MKVSLLVARQRSGTGALGSVLDQQPRIKALGEVFHDAHVGEPDNFFTFLLERVRKSSTEALPGARKKQLMDYFQYLEGRYEQYDNIIIDVKYDSLHHFNGFWHGPYQIPVLLRFCIEQHIAVLHLTRKNILKTLVSGVLAEKNRVWHATTADELQIKSVTIDPKHLYNSLSGTHREVEFISGFIKRLKKYIELDYEEIFDAVGSLHPNIEQKLALFYARDVFVSRKPAYVKQTPDRLEAVIENFAEIKAKLENTPYAWMISN